MSLERTTKRNLTHWNGIVLPAGAYTVRASSTQFVQQSITGANTGNTASHASVTTTRATLVGVSQAGASTTGGFDTSTCRQTTFAATTAEWTRETNSGTARSSYHINELV